MDDTGQQRLNILCTFILIVAISEVLCSVTVEEGEPATLQCPGFTPNPGGDQSAVFNWYKAREADLPPGEKLSDHRVAFLTKRDGVFNSERDLDGRATIDSTTGALQITHTTGSDDHVYTCYFLYTSMGSFKNETYLTITGGQFIGVAIKIFIGIGGFMAGVAVAVSVYQCRKNSTGQFMPSKQFPIAHYSKNDPTDIAVRRMKGQTIYWNKYSSQPLLFQPPLGTGQPPQVNDSGYEIPVVSPDTSPKTTSEPFA